MQEFTLDRIDDGGAVLTIPPEAASTLLRQLGIPDPLIEMAKGLPATERLFKAILLDAMRAVEEMKGRSEPIDMGENSLLRGPWLKYCRQDLIDLHIETWRDAVNAHYQVTNAGKVQTAPARDAKQAKAGAKTEKARELFKIIRADELARRQSRKDKQDVIAQVAEQMNAMGEAYETSEKSVGRYVTGLT